MPRKRRNVTLAIGGSKGATCGDLLALLNDYVDGAADPGLCRELEAHLKACNPCQMVVDTIRKTIRLYRQNEPCELPPEFRTRLHECLRNHWRKGAGAENDIP
jgi:anti-sigma factor RsiW